MHATDNGQTCQLMVVGAGMAGMAATLFAARRGISTIQAGLTGETLYASGLFDLYGVAHGEARQLIDDPWQGLVDLRRTHPDHPLARVAPDHIRQGMALLTDFLGAAGYPYAGYADRNLRLITSIGTIKRSFRVPATMWDGVKALETKPPCLIVDIEGLRGFSARQIVAVLKPSWPALHAATVAVPFEGRLGPKYAEHIARGLHMQDARRALADIIRPRLGRAEAVGLPAVLGIQETEAIRTDLNRMLGVPVFEIPTMPPAISGIRLKEAFEIHMPRLGITPFYHHTVHTVDRRPDGRFVLSIGRTSPETTVIADNVLLATGRFLGKGLLAQRDGIREALLNLPVCQPHHRGRWHRNDFLDPRGHAINLAGVDVNDRFQPITADGCPVYANVYAAGSILAHQDWIRTKSGTGLAVATAYAAVDAMIANGDDGGPFPVVVRRTAK